MNIYFNRFPNGSKKALTMSYDDGNIADRRLVEIFNKYGIKGTFHLNSGRFGKYDNIEAEEVGELYRGHEVSCHTVTHPFPTIMPREKMLSEILDDRINLEKLCGYPVRGMSYPYGLYDDNVVNVFSSAGIEYSRTVDSTNRFSLPTDYMRWHPTCHHSHDIMQKLNDFENDNSTMPKLFYIWGHSYEFDRNDNWNIIEDFCAAAGNRGDEFWYATNIEIVDYLNALKALRFTANCDKVYNPSCIKCVISADDKAVVINPGETVSL